MPEQVKKNYHNQNRANDQRTAHPNAGKARTNNRTPEAQINQMKSATKPVLTPAAEGTGNYSYKMPETMAKILLKDRKGDELKMTPQEYLCYFVNTNYGLLRPVVCVTTF